MTHAKNPDIEAQAQRWVVALSAEDVDQSVIDKFKAWHQHSREHAEAFIRADRVWQSIAGLNHLRAYAQPPMQSQTSAPIQAWLTSLTEWLASLGAPVYATLSLMFVVLASFILIQYSPDSNEGGLVKQFQTVQGEVVTIDLEDGSKMTLGALTRVQVTYQTDERKINLAQGEALFDVVSNPEQPFVVTTGETETRVLGTVFAVERRTDSVTVAVREGRVRVGPRLANKTPVLTAGQKVRADLHGQTGAIENVPIENVGAWQQGRLVFDNEPLKAIIATANRYFEKQIILADTSRADTRLSLSLSLDDIDSFVEDLAALLNMQVTRSGNAILLEAK